MATEGDTGRLQTSEHVGYETWSLRSPCAIPRDSSGHRRLSKFKRN